MDSADIPSLTVVAFFCANSSAELLSFFIVAVTTTSCCSLTAEPIAMFTIVGSPVLISTSVIVLVL